MEKYEEKSFLAMPCYGAHAQGEGMIGTDESGRNKPLRQHVDLISELGDTCEDFIAMVHTAIPDGKIWAIPKAKESVDGVWKKLHKKNAFGMSKVKERQEVKEMYEAMKEPVHFGTVRKLCHRPQDLQRQGGVPR